MNYYAHHIGDFRSGTINMTRVERWIYRDLIDIYYDTEKLLPLDVEKVCDLVGARSEEECKIVAYLLRAKFQKRDDGYWHERCSIEINAYHAKAETARANGKSGGRPPKNKTNQEPTGNPAGYGLDADGNQDETGLQANQEPRTKNQENLLVPPSGLTNRKPKSPQKHGSEEDFETARWLFGRNLKINPSASPPNWEDWANTVRLIREIDGRTHRQICELYQWAKSDSFWSSNIRGPDKLRKQWDQLTERRAASTPPPPEPKKKDWI